MSYGIYQLQPDTNNLSQLSVVTMPATTNRVGGVKQGANVTIAADGTISVPASYILPIATGSTLGGVKIGSGVTVTADGTISVPPAGPMVWG